MKGVIIPVKNKYPAKLKEFLSPLRLSNIDLLEWEITQMCGIWVMTAFIVGDWLIIDL